MRWLLGDGNERDLSYARHVLDALAEPETQALVPCIWPLEVGNVITRAEARGLLTEARSSQFLRLLDDLAIATDTETAPRALKDTLQLARRFALSAYAAAYLELALRRGLPLATLDAALQHAATEAVCPGYSGNVRGAGAPLPQGTCPVSW